ncbi:MAG: 1,4-dihydroxy-2-naphthoate polyprenyltransferase [Actinomycetota bacterium]|nr:1,4-dihydroxy-2-naphthoate polyprenyltransferase [Actinomycetota bacterium]
MNKWIVGARVKTLPAAVSPVIIGTSFANDIDWFKALLALIVSCTLQIGVNYANDYSDGIRGTDADRIGPTRLVASGLATANAVRNAAIISFVIAAIAGSVLSISSNRWLIIIGAISILAAWGYTGGKKPYGYLGFGELAVFVFFGLVATVGSYFVQSATINWQIFLLSVPVGCLSCSILVLNNLRDLSKDKLVNKSTLAVFLGDKNTRMFYVILLAISQVLLVFSSIIDIKLLATLVCIPITFNLSKRILSGVSGVELVSVLAQTASLQLLLSIITAGALFI